MSNLSPSCLLGPLAQLEDLELAELVGQRLARPGDVAVGLGLDRRLVLRRMLVEEVDHLLARPVLVVHAGVEHQPIGAQQFIGQMAVVAQRVLIETDFLAEPLGIQRPAFDVGGVAGLLAERRQVRQRLRDRDLHVMAGHAFVVRGRFDVERAGGWRNRRCSRRRGPGACRPACPGCTARRWLPSRGIPRPASLRHSSSAAGRTTPAASAASARCISCTDRRSAGATSRAPSDRSSIAARIAARSL